MSHANGEVIRDGKIAGHFEYNGTSDIACNRIYATREEMRIHWRTEHADDASCSCGNAPIAITLYTDYGNGYHWPGTACLRCGVILSGFEYPDDPIDGHPLRDGANCER